MRKLNMERTFTVRQVEGGVPLKCWTKGVPVEDKAIEQLERVARMPFIVAPIAVMPDVHVGKGSTVGSVIATSGAIMPATVGVDIGCGMVAQRIKIDSSRLTNSKAEIRVAIEAKVPHGRSDDGGSNDCGAWKDPPNLVRTYWDRLKGEYEDFLARKYPRLDRGASITQLGTLGTGNHFIEICLDEEDMGWIVIHSGSRGPGNRIGTDFTRLAREENRRWFIELSDPDLAYLPEGTEFFADYLNAVDWAQRYAMCNRAIMLSLVLEALVAMGLSPGLPVDFDQLHPFAAESLHIDCRHNYVELENHLDKNMLVTRKGAVRARKGDWGIIPGSMGARSFIVRGFGSPDSLQSCSHGAGRLMSRTEARKRFTVADHEAATRGIECAKDESVLDETPGSYKDIDAVMHAQLDLVEVVHTLRQVVCVKGGKG
jgi:tRNA-splicing ligase RtcB (3'-phosphate/5'-hydroxy nucleic acid ligase)